MKYQVAIIGGGPAGYTAAEAAGKAGLSVVLFEKQSLGGVCLNEGCIPTKTLLYSAKTYDGARHAAKYAVSVPEVSWKFDGSNWTQLRDIADTDSDNDYDDDYAITRSEAVSFVIGGRGFVATGIRNSTSLSSDYWLYDPDKDLWYGDSDDDFTPITDVHNYPSGASSRRAAVGFSTGERGFVLTGTSGTSYFDDVYELLPDEEEEV